MGEDEAVLVGPGDVVDDEGEEDGPGDEGDAVGEAVTVTVSAGGVTVWVAVTVAVGWDGSGSDQMVIVSHGPVLETVATSTATPTTEAHDTVRFVVTPAPKSTPACTATVLDTLPAPHLTRNQNIAEETPDRVILRVTAAADVSTVGASTNA